MDKSVNIKAYLSGRSSQNPKETPCIFCKKTTENQLTIINYKSDILGALASLGVKYEAIPGVLDQACYQCVYRINVMIDFRRLMERNLNKTRANYFYSIGNHEMSTKYLIASSGHIPTTIPTKEQLELLLANVQSDSDPDLHTADYLFDCFNDPPRYSVQKNNSVPSPSKLLTPMFETSESVMCTESGGQIDVETKYTNYNNLSDKQYNYKCQFCTKTYKRLHFLQRHQRKHRIPSIRRSSSVRSTRTDRTHQCTHCDEVFDKRLQLSKHEQSHQNRTKCSYCAEEFYLLCDLELHEAKCLGEKFARDETESVKSRYYTRSRSMSRHRHQNLTVDDDDDDDNDDDDDDDDEEENGPRPVLHKEVMKNVDDWVGLVDLNYSEYDYNNDHADVDDCDNDWDDNVSVYSSATTLFTRRRQIERRESPEVCVLERKNYCDQQRTPAKRTRLRSIASNISRGTRAAAKRKKSYDRLEQAIQSQRDETIQFEHHLEYRTETFIKQENDGSDVLMYKCLTCSEEFPRLSTLMTHEVEIHNLIIMYTCLQCKYSFTRRVFYARHELKHMDRICKCFLCSDEFISQTELDFHLKMHDIRSYRCNFCDQSFLTKQRLAQHMLAMNHLANERVKMETIKLFDEPNGDEVIEEDDHDVDDDGKTTFRQFRIRVPRWRYRQKYQRRLWIMAPHYEPPEIFRCEFLPLFNNILDFVN